MTRLTRLSIAIAMLALTMLTAVAYAHDDDEIVLEAIVQTANQYLATLDPAQTAESVFAFDSQEKHTWSNLPVNMVPRAGIAIGSLTTDQYAAFEALLNATLSDAGMAKITGIIAADGYLAELEPNNRFGWSSENYFVSFYGTPDLAGTWGYQLTGHHLALNLTMVDGQVSVTPTLLGVEPVNFTYESVEYAPLDNQSLLGFELVNALDADQLAEAQLSGSRGLVLGAGEDGTAAPTQTGVLVGEMSEEQQALVVALIEEYFGMVDEALAETILAGYVAEFDQTTFAWSGSTDMATATSSYYRLHGPSVWIELSMEGSIAQGTGEFHYHTMMRDLQNDFGAALITASAE
jgi:hypothetical protein